MSGRYCDYISYHHPTLRFFAGIPSILEVNREAEDTDEEQVISSCDYTEINQIENVNANMNKHFQRAVKVNAMTTMHQNCYGSYYHERPQCMSRKFQTLAVGNEQRSASTNCPVHSKKDLNKLEECYWAQWKPSKTASMCRTSTVPTKFLETTTLPLTCMSANYTHCKNCHKLVRKHRCQCYRNVMNAFSSTSDCSEMHATNCVMYHHHRFDDTTDCDCQTTARDGDATEVGFTDVMSKDEVSVFAAGREKPIKEEREEKKMYDKCVCCPCEVGIKTDSIVMVEKDVQDSEGTSIVTKPLYVNKSCITRSSDVITTVRDSYGNSLLSPSIGSRPESLLTAPRSPNGGSEYRESWGIYDHNDIYNKVAVNEYTSAKFSMDDECCGSSTALTPSKHSIGTNSMSSHAQKTLPLSSNPNSVLLQLTGDAPPENPPEIEIGQFQYQESRPVLENVQNANEHPKKHVHVVRDSLEIVNQSIGKLSTTSSPPHHKGLIEFSPKCKAHGKDLIRHMKKLSEYIPDEAKFLVKQVANIITSEPVAEIKRQAERIVESALAAEAEKQRQRVKSASKQNAYVPSEPSIKEIDSAQTQSVKSSANPLQAAATITIEADKSSKSTNITAAHLQLEGKQVMEGQQQTIDRENHTAQEELRQLQQQQLRQKLVLQKQQLEEQQRQIQHQRELQQQQLLQQQQKLQQQLLLQQQAEEQQKLKQQLQIQRELQQQMQRQQDQQRQGDQELQLKLQDDLMAQQRLRDLSLQPMQPSPRMPILKTLQGALKLSSDSTTSSNHQVPPQRSVLSAAAARVTGVLRHSYPLGKSSSKKTSGRSLVGKLRK